MRKLFCRHIWNIDESSIRLYKNGSSKEALYECEKCGKKIWHDIYNMKPNKYVFRLYDKGQISDGSHTFDELYYHRMVLFSLVCNEHNTKAWKSWKHHDGTMYDNYFIVGIDTPHGQYSYHYHKSHWSMFNVKVLELAPEWDGHEPKDIHRLLSLYK